MLAPDDMKPFWSTFLAVVSLCVLAGEPGAARPRYGGTLRLQTQGTIRTLDPAIVPANAMDAGALRHMLPLVFETLIGVDSSGGLRPLLASSWAVEAQGIRWRVRLRGGVRLHDGSALETSHVVDALRASQKEWQIATDGDTIVIDPGRTQPDVPWALADGRSAIAVRRASGELLGTGPFRVERLEASRVTLRAHDDYWGSRAFLDAIHIDTGRPLAAQLSDLELDRTDMVVVQPTDRRRLSQRGLRVVASKPLELFALVFEVHRASAASEAIRRTLASTIDRSAICRVLLQEQAEPAEALLPRWLSGYDPFALVRQGRPLSRTSVAALPPDQRVLTLRAEASDSVARLMAERIAVDASERGFSIAVQAPTGLAPRPDIRLLRMKLEPTTPDRALAGVMATLGSRILTYVSREPSPSPGAPLNDTLRVERALLEHDVIVPVVHVSEIYGLGQRLDAWNGPPVLPSGAWDLANVWLRAESQ
jgi:peptide/nickel transport system substrate-binding protein